MSLQDLPPELIQKVLSHLAWSDLDPFSRTSHRHRALATPHLCREALLLSANGRTLRRQVADVGAALRGATAVTVASPVPDESVKGSIRSRCPGCDIKDFEKEGETGEALIHEVLRNCRPGRLKKFTWLLGVCVQDDILGPAGLLATHQRNIEEIRLATCYHRLGIRCQTRQLDLTPFAHLRALAWTGIHRSQFRAVERALEAAAPRLVELELDYLSSTANRDAGLDFHDLGYFAAVLLGRLKQGQEVFFPRLERLSLTNVVLDTVRMDEFVTALNALNLRALKLKQCPGWRSFISRVWLLAPDTLSLRSLEVHSFPREDDWDSHVASQIAQVLRRCPALEELAVYRLNGTASIPGTGLLLLDVQAPALRRVVVHESSPLTGNMAAGRVWEDVPRLLPEDRSRHNLLSTSRMEFLGYAAPTGQVKTLLDELTPPEAIANLQVLHVRQDHEEVPDYYSRALGRARPDKGAQGRVNLWRMLTHTTYHFAAWAFSTNKLPSLKLLAFGDFGSLDPRFRLLVCRSGDPEEPFRLVGEGDGEVVGLLDEFLDSMVVGPTYSRPYLRESGASLAGNVWRAGLGRALARESGGREPTIPEG